MNKPIDLNTFFIFNSLLGPKEGEEAKKILYYHPSSDNTEFQIKNVGLVEGIIQFTETFRPSHYVGSVHTTQQRHLYFQPEPNFWLVMCLSVPLTTKIKDNASTSEYLEEDLQDNVHKAILKQAYFLYRLFWGTFASCKTDNLKNQLHIFFNAYLKSLKLASADILNIFGGIQYLPLEQQIFLKVQSFVNMLESNWPCVEQVTFLYNDHVIWSGIEPDDMQIMYQYLVGTLLPAHVETELQGGSIPRNSPFAALKRGRFITGPTDLKHAHSIGTIPKVYLFRDQVLNEYHLVVYRSLSATICLYVKGDSELTLDLFKRLDEFINPKLTAIVTEVAEYCSKQALSSLPASVETTLPKFIYFNKMNLAYKSTIHLDNKQSGNVACSRDSLKIMADVKAHSRFLGSAGESILKTMNDFWVVGKTSNLREFYIVLQQKNASLIEISEEVKKLCDGELKGIFFHPF